MHDALLVGVRQPVADLRHDRQLVLEGQIPPLPDEVPEILALQQLHDDEESPVILAEVMHGHDVGVAQPGARLRLTEEAGAELVRDGGLAGDELERDEALQYGVVGFEDHAHATAADPFENLGLPDLLRHCALDLSTRPGGTARSRSLQ